MTYPQAPQFPGVPQQQQGYPAQQMPMAPQGYPQVPQQFAPQQFPQQPEVQLAAGSLDAFYSQPTSGGGASLQFVNVGDAHVWVVNRPLADGDVEQQVNPRTKQPEFYKNGKPKFVLKVPVNVPVSERHTEGRAQWYCQGSAKDELNRAKTAAGAPQGAPEFGAFGYTKKAGTRQIPGSAIPANVWEVTYVRPGPEAKKLAEQYGIAYPELSGNGAAPAAAPAPAPAAPVAPVAPPAPPASPAAPVAPVAPQMAAPAPPAPGVAEGLPADKAALLAQLTGQQG